MNTPEKGGDGVAGGCLLEGSPAEWVAIEAPCCCSCCSNCSDCCCFWSLRVRITAAAACLLVSPQPAQRPAPGRSSALPVTSPAALRVARAQRPGGPGRRPHPSCPGSACGGGGVGPGDRGPAAADGGRPQRAVRAAETRRAASTPTLTLEGHVQSLHGTPPLTQGSWSPRNGAQLGAYTRPGDVGDLGGRTPSAF